MKKLILALVAAVALAFTATAIGVNVGGTPAHADPCESSNCG